MYECLFQVRNKTDKDSAVTMKMLRKESCMAQTQSVAIFVSVHTIFY